MSLHDPVLTVNGQQPWLFSTLIQFPVVCFTGAFIMDVVYWRSTSFEWVTFSVWLLAAGLAMAGIAAIVALIERIRSRPIPINRAGLAYGVIVFVLSLVNAFVHSRDGYTAVVPTGITLSSLVVILMVVGAYASHLNASRIQESSIDKA